MIKAIALSVYVDETIRSKGWPAGLPPSPPFSNTRPATNGDLSTGYLVKEWEFPKGSIKAKFVIELTREDATLLFGVLPGLEDHKHFRALCRPGAPLQTGAAVAASWGDGTFIPGILMTKRPERSKYFKVHAVRHGRLLYAIDYIDVFPIVAVKGYR